MTVSVEHVNFFENLKEVSIRLHNTVVLYDGRPMYVLAESDHAPDGIIRLYLDDLSNPQGPAHKRVSEIPYNDYGHSSGVGEQMDKWLKAHPDYGIVRKMMNSPKFNKYRPFPLGMCNYVGGVHFLERRPLRQTHQGLIDLMMASTPITMSKIHKAPKPSIFSLEFADTVMGLYPSFSECIDALSDERVTNESVAFDRNFAVLRGPVDGLYLAYKHDVVGMIEGKSLRLGPGFKHTKEVIQKTGLFTTVN